MLKLGLFLFVASGLALLLLSVAWSMQRSVLFPAPPARPLPGDREAELVNPGRTTSGYQALLLPSRDAARARSPVVIFAHGNGELADDWIDAFEPMRDWGWSVLLLEYPGYGGSPGTPSESSIRDAALTVFDWAAAEPRIDAARMVVYGRSIGGGAAVQIATARPVAALILESSFTSTRPLAARYGIPGWLVRDVFDNLDALRGYRGPTLVIHGSEDQLIPVSEGRALAASVSSAEFHALPCGHNDCPRPWGLIRGFLESHGLLTAGHSSSR
jgi:pimeloyl-ACP methyl ester carboxylesterase